MFPQTAMQDIRISGSAECAVDIKDHRLFTDMGREVQALFCTACALRGINNVGRKPLAQQCRFATARRADDHIPRQLPQETAVVEMALQAQQPAVKITLLGVQFHAERINGFLALLLLHFFKLLQALHHPDGKPHQGNNPPRRRCQPAVRQWFEPLFFIQRPRRAFPPDPHQQKNPRQYQQPESRDFKPGHRRSQG